MVHVDNIIMESFWSSRKKNCVESREWSREEISTINRWWIVYPFELSIESSMRRFAENLCRVRFFSPNDSWSIRSATISVHWINPRIWPQNYGFSSWHVDEDVSKAEYNLLHLFLEENSLFSSFVRTTITVCLIHR